jgi:hypothetical protein
MWPNLSQVIKVIGHSPSSNIKPGSCHFERSSEVVHLKPGDRAPNGLTLRHDRGDKGQVGVFSADSSGNSFAKVLEDALTGDFPVVSYRKQTFIVSDNRIPALSSDRSQYLFAALAPGSPVTVTAELRFRRNFQADMDVRGWDEADIVMAKKPSPS